MSRLLSADLLGDARPLTMAALGRNGGGTFQARFADGQQIERSRPSFAVAKPEEPAVDPVERVRADAFAQGFDEGIRVATENFAAEEDAAARLAQALEQIAPAANGTLSTLLSAAVLRLVTRIVGEAPVDAGLLARRVEAVAAFIEEGQGRQRLHVNPDDMVLLEGREFGLELTPDPAVGRGSVRLDTADGWIEDGPDVQLSRLRTLLDTIEGSGPVAGEGNGSAVGEPVR